MKFCSLPLVLSFACAARADTGTSAGTGTYDETAARLSPVISVNPPASDDGLKDQAAGGLGLNAQAASGMTSLPRRPTLRPLSSPGFLSNV